mmetsp:Transcript_25881/g.73652  ORF Transcript_25881/g.73652 Transcript_25881/m.73652 type:complete len:282 (+) Transcript_25881:67-912(+)
MERFPLYSARHPEDLARASEHELRAALAAREAAAAELLKEIEAFERGPERYERRLAELERYFSDMRAGDTVLLFSPPLYQTGKFMEEEGARASPNGWVQRCDLVAEHHRHFRDTASDAQGDSYNPLHPRDLVLGNACMLIDHVADDYAANHDKRRKALHPTIEKQHFAGHLSREVEPIPQLFVGHNGLWEEQRPRASEPASTFWLDKSSPPGSRGALVEEGGSPQERLRQAAAFDERAAGRVRVEEQDRTAVDWLGLARRGLPIPEDLQGPSGDPVDLLPF